jgi:hypothetical protein
LTKPGQGPAGCGNASRIDTRENPVQQRQGRRHHDPYGSRHTGSPAEAGLAGAEILRQRRPTNFSWTTSANQTLSVFNTMNLAAETTGREIGPLADPNKKKARPSRPGFLIP